MHRSTDVRVSPRRTALWVLVVQCLLALSWTMYVLFLPGMLDAVGIARRWFVYVLMLDQLVFAACDWMAGVHVDRIATVRRRTGRAITAVTLLSSAALLVMPWVAVPGNAALLLVVIVFWSATSSALRAPVFALLGRIREASSGSADGATIGRRGGVGLGLVGIGLAGAIGPYMTMLLKGVDPRLPIAVSAAALAAAGSWATRAEEHLPRPAAATPSGTAVARRRTHRAWSLVAVMLIAGFGTQVALPLVLQPLLRRFVGDDAMLWVAWYWVGFALGLIPGTRVASMTTPPGRSLVGAAIALVAASIVLAVGLHGDALAVLVIAITIAGGAWGLFTTVVFANAVALSDGRATVNGAGTASGLLFSAIAVGTLLRLACVAAGWSRATVIVWVPIAAWVTGGALLLVFMRTLWRPAHPHA